MQDWVSVSLLQVAKGDTSDLEETNAPLPLGGPRVCIVSELCV